MSLLENLKCKNLEEVALFSRFKTISRDDPKYKNYTHCSHAMIYAKTNSKSLERYNTIAMVLVSI